MSFKLRKKSNLPTNPSAVVLSNESQELYAETRAAYFDRFQPADQVEADLVDRIVAIQWRLDRVVAMEAASINLAMKAAAQTAAETMGAVDGVTRAALAVQALEGPEGLTSSLLRSEASLSARYHNAVDHLLSLQGRRRTREELEKMQERT